MNEFPDKNPDEFTKDEIIQILTLEKRQNKKVLFYKPKNDLMPEICFPFYDREGNEENALKNGRVKNLVICKFLDCNAVLVCPSLSKIERIEKYRTKVKNATGILGEFEEIFGDF
ncbi:hypothetical protein ACQ4LE_010374 [Meloidogyne hapla]|uniref:Ferredoxin-thioredoxin reductase subunit B n=1 Tax=Meloidogyne hapla TaxID=6305 RepID=A0A1I8BK95_MELHA